MEEMKILKMSKRSILTGNSKILDFRNTSNETNIVKLFLVVVVVTSQNTVVQRYNSLVNGKRRMKILKKRKRIFQLK